MCFNQRGYISTLNGSSLKLVDKFTYLGSSVSSTETDLNMQLHKNASSNIEWRQHPTKQQLYGHQPLITKTIKARWTRHAGHCWRSKDELISDVFLWTPSHGRAKAGRPARTYIQQVCADTGCSPEDLPEAMDNREGWQKRVRDMRAAADDDKDNFLVVRNSHQLCFTYIYIYIYIYIRQHYQTNGYATPTIHFTSLFIWHINSFKKNSLKNYF